MDESRTRMQLDIREIPGAAAELLSGGQAAAARAARQLARHDPSFLITVARGSSDHVCTYLKYAAGLALGLPVASAAPSIASIHGADLRLRQAGCLAVSQSGRSPDLVAMARSATRSGALSVALTNDSGSPVAAACRRAVPICAGHERSIAATKTFLNSAVAGLMLLAEWKDDSALRAALRRLPDALARAVDIDWSADLLPAFRSPSSAFVLGRGLTLAMADEAALKMKEACGIHAESHSSAELFHGPVSLLERGFPVLVLATADACEVPLARAADILAAKGARVFATTGKADRARRLRWAATGHPFTDPLALIASFYGFVEALCRCRGADAARHLQKVTETT